MISPTLDPTSCAKSPLPPPVSDPSAAPASGRCLRHTPLLDEAWDSGALAWNSQRREAYANDQGAEPSLVAVTARSNRSKADQDPRSGSHPPPRRDAGMPPSGWAPSSAVDEGELAALEGLASNCPEETVTYEPAA